MADEQSIWKKEISFGRKRKQDPTPEDVERASSDTQADEPTSMWKKEISFGRKKKAAPEPEPVVDPEPVAPAEEEAEEPAWTRAVSFGRKTEPEPAATEPVLEVVPEPAADDAGPVEGSDPEPGPEETPAEEPAWTPTVSFGPKTEPDGASEERVLEVVPEPAADDAGPVEGSDPEPGPEETSAEEPAWTRAVSFGRKSEPEEAADPPVLEVVPESVVDDAGPVEGSDPEPGPEETSAEEPAWTRAVSFARKSEPEEAADPPVLEALPELAVDDAGPVQGSDPQPGPEETTLVANAQPVVEAEPVQGSDLKTGPEETRAEEPAWTRAVSFAPSSETPESSPGPPVTPTVEAVTAAAPPVPQPQPGVHAPVTAEELPPLEEPAKNVPFWKRDLSFGGGKKKTPKAERAPKQKKEKKTRDSEGAQKAPFWKRDISLGGSKDTPEAPTENKAKNEKEPRERKAKQRKQPKQPKQPKVKAERGSKGAKRIVGLKVGASQLAAARVANNGSAELLQVAREPLEPGIVVGGELRDPDALAEALKEFFGKHKLPKKGVRLGIANNRIGVRTFDIAGVADQKQLTNAVRFRAQEALPIPIDEAVLDFQVLGEDRSQDGEPIKRILLVVAYRELIDRYVDACRKAGITLSGIDLEAFALLRALQPPPNDSEDDPRAALVAVAVGHDRSTFAVSDGRICEFTRVLEWGGSALNVAIARAIDAAPSEVDEVKRALTLTDETVPEGLTPEQAKKAREAMRRAIQTFARELVSSLQYYQNQPGSLGIGEIVLTGGTAHLHGLSDELEQLIGVRVRIGDPLARMKVSKRVGEAEQIGSLAVAIGLGIED